MTRDISVQTQHYRVQGALENMVYHELYPSQV